MKWRGDDKPKKGKKGEGVNREDFQLLATLGRGQWGKVFLVKKPGTKPGQPAIGDLLALKEVQLTPSSNCEHVQNERLIMEYVPAHPFIIGMHYAMRTRRFLYFALDFASGGDLFRFWRQHREKRGEMAPFFAAEVLLALEHLHKHNVIYRDLKPENVLLDAEGHIKLADMGLAKLLQGKDGRTSSFCGTEAYLAPEMILRLPYGMSVDLWQYGCFVFELYAGRSPFWLPRKPRKFVRENILNGTFGYPSTVPESVKPLILALLEVNEPRRLGCGSDGWASVKMAPYFAAMDWNKVAGRLLKPPVVPEDPGPDFVNNFDKELTAQTPAFGEDQDETHVWLEEELAGFDYVRDPYVDCAFACL